MAFSKQVLKGENDLAAGSSAKIATKLYCTFITVKEKRKQVD